ncbi:MAG: hypothetical protein U1D30_25760, partial [Planctomycetota bacterium]
VDKPPEETPSDSQDVLLPADATTESPIAEPTKPLPDPSATPSVNEPPPKVSPASPLPTRPSAKLSVPKDAKSLRDIISRCRSSFQEISGGYSAELLNVHAEDGREEKQTIRIRSHVPSGKVLLEWLDTRKEGRQIAFDGHQPDANVDIVLGPAEPKLLGQRLSLPPNHLLVRIASHFPTTKTGIHAWIDHLEMMANATERQETRWGTVELAELQPMPGKTKRNAYRIRQNCPPENPELVGLTAGGFRDWFVDAELMLPTMVVDHDANGNVVESMQLLDVTIDAAITPDSVQIGNF